MSSSNNNQQPFAVFDIDGTLVRWQLYHAVANQLLRDGADAQLYASITEARRAWQQRSHPLSFRDYEHALAGHSDG